MRAVVYNGIGKIDVEERPMPPMGPKDVILKNMRAGICGTDLGAYLRGGDDVGIFPGNEIGHEFVSVVHEVGAEVSGITPGMRVWVNPVLSKRQGEGRSPVEIADSASGLTQYVQIHDAALGYNLYELPDNVSFDKAVVIEPFAVANHGVNTADPQPGQRAIIYGAGAIGLGVLCNLLAKGVKDVIVSDIVPKRLEIVEQLGGIPVNGKETDPIEFAIEKFGSVEDMNGNKKPDVDLFFDAAGAPNAISDYVRGGKPTSKMVVLALSANTVEIPQAAFVLSELAILGSTAYNEKDISEVIGFLGAEAYDPTPVVTHHFAQEDAAQAFVTAIEDSDNAVKVVIDVHP